MKRNVAICFVGSLLKLMAGLLILCVLFLYLKPTKSEVVKLDNSVSFQEIIGAKEIWRGKLLKNIQFFGPWAILRVGSPDDNWRYRFEMDVIYHGVTEAKYELRRLQVGQEIFFHKAYVMNNNHLSASLGSTSSYTGFFVSLKDNPAFTGNGFKIMNPPKK
jgi:hypothetical protein